MLKLLRLWLRKIASDTHSAIVSSIWTALLRCWLVCMALPETNITYPKRKYTSMAINVIVVVLHIGLCTDNMALDKESD